MEWDDEKYFLRSCKPEAESFCEAVATSKYAGFEEPLMRVAKHTVFLAHGEEEDYEQVGASRFGGWPDLPSGTLYPTSADAGEPYEFIAQLDCEQLAPLQDYLPREGTLYFFIDNWETFRPLVFHAPKGTPLVPASQVEETVGECDTERYDGYKAIALAGWSLPSDYAGHTNTHYFENAPELADEDGLTTQVAEELCPCDSYSHHEINGYVFTQHESPELAASLVHRGRPQDWTVLLKVASLGDFQWCDAGEMFFVIHKSDLEKGDFRGVYTGLESS